MEEGDSKNIGVISKGKDTVIAEATPTVAEALRGQFDQFTRAERQLADTLLAHYPVSGLSSITALAESALVSTPTVVRLVKKLGFSGYPQFQARLREELAATISSPVAKHERWAERAPEAHILNRFAEAAIDNLHRTLSRFDTQTFDAVAELLADTDRQVAIVGGRITRSLADYLFTHMQVIRDGLSLVPSTTSTWPHYLLGMRPGDVLVVFDIRRYETELIRFVEMARAREATIVLFTDQWGSPAAKHAHHVLPCRIEVPSAWDSTMVMLFVVEALIAAVQTQRWETTRDRFNELEGLFDQARLFKKFT